MIFFLNVFTNSAEKVRICPETQSAKLYVSRSNCPNEHPP